MTTSERPAEQRADIHGSGNVIVQILGDDNRVDLGRPYLRLTRYLARRAVDAEADLLNPYTRSIPLTGRQQEMTELRAWLESASGTNSAKPCTTSCHKFLKARNRTSPPRAAVHRWWWSARWGGSRASGG